MFGTLIPVPVHCPSFITSFSHKWLLFTWLTVHIFTLKVVCMSLSLSLSLSPSGWKSLGWGVSHTGSASPLSSILHVHQVEPQVLHVILHDVDPPFSLSTPTPLSMYIGVQDSPDTILLFLTLYMPKPSQPGLPYLVRDACYSEDVTDINIPFLVSQCKAENPS